MRNLPKFIILLLLGILLGSCSPVYKITHDLSPPKTVNGLICIKGCQSQLNQCNRQCSKRFDQCSIKAEQQARKELPALLHAYPQKLQLWLNSKAEYERDLDWHEFRRHMSDSRRDYYLDRCEKKGKNRSYCSNSFYYQHDFLQHDRPSFNIPRPIQPSLANVAAKIRKLSCNKNCRCNSKYRLCYSSCGGVIKSKKLCIKNCND